MKLKLKIRGFVKASICLISLFFVMHLVVSYESIVAGRERLFGLNHLFDLNGEQSLPSLYQSLTLLLAGCLAAFVAMNVKKSGGRYAGHWKILAIIFTLMGIDESVSMHEFIGANMVGPALHLEGKFHAAWLVFGIPLVIFFVLVFLPFFISLSNRDKALFFLAGAIYVSGAALIEIPANLYSPTHGEHNLYFTTVSGIEELFEMVGVLILNTALLKKILQGYGGAGIGFEVTND